MIGRLMTDLTALGRPDRERIEALLGVTFEQKTDAGPFIAYEANAIGGPFGDMTFRRFADGERGILNMQPIDDLDATLEELELYEWGEPTLRGMNPRVPPEGVEDLVFVRDTVQLWVSLRASSRVLHSVTLKWNMPLPAVAQPEAP